MGYARALHEYGGGSMTAQLIDGVAIAAKVRG